MHAGCCRHWTLLTFQIQSCFCNHEATLSPGRTSPECQMKLVPMSPAVVSKFCCYSFCPADGRLRKRCGWENPEEARWCGLPGEWNSKAEIKWGLWKEKEERKLERNMKTDRKRMKKKRRGREVQQFVPVRSGMVLTLQSLQAVCVCWFINRNVHWIPLVDTNIHLYT